MDTLRAFYNEFPTVKVAKGDILFQQSDTPDTGYAIKQGIVKIYNITSLGNEKIVSFKVADEPFPLGWLLNKSTTAMFFYQAHTDCELYVINKEKFTLHLDQNPAFARQIMNVLANAYVSASLQIDALVQTSADLKLLYAFRHLSLRYGRDVKEDVSILQIPLTQQDLASYTGLARETTAIKLKELKARGVITYDHKYYTINTKEVNELIEDEYDPGVATGL